MGQFTEGELEVMKILWERGELKPREIQECFPRAIKNNSLRSYLTILFNKGHLTRKRRGKAFYYRAKTRRQTAMREQTSRLLDVFYGGSAEALLCHLIKSEDLSSEDLLELKRLAVEDSSSRKQKKGKQS